MSHFANPPKLRSYVDHKPNTTTDYFMKMRRPRTYIDHWLDNQSQIFFKPNRAYINSYIDHFAAAGDLNQM